MIAPGIPETLLPLTNLRCNEAACIAQLVGNECQIHRLAEMGLCVGAEVRMVCTGSPCLLAVNGKRLSLRLSSDVDVLVATET